jgi:ABC-type multidrug transport system fused ATPase/permease subunit
MRSSHINGIMLGFTTSILYYAIAAAYTLGAYLVQNNLFGMTLENIMIVFGCIMFGAQSVGQASSLMPDYSKAKAAINSMFELLERKPKINNWESSGIKLGNDFESNISLVSLKFSYPTRPEAKILKGIDLDITQGQRVAFVGSSGCGMSNLIDICE